MLQLPENLKKVNITIEDAQTHFDTVFNYGILWALCSIGIFLTIIRGIIKKKPFISFLNKEIPYHQYMGAKLYVLTACISLTAGFPTHEETFNGAGAAIIAILLFGTTVVKDYVLDKKQKRNLNR
ncbi:hypothetical protein [Chitinophaga sp.]|uniref:hypothetical protein n=1 Tax=Chitinophaga sp. TaxID=1869181 RepID=UPI0031DF749B